MLASQNRRAFTLVELLVVLAIIAVLIGLLIPAAMKVRWATERSQSSNNLHQLMMAAHSFHDANGFLPFNGTGDATSADNTSGSWAYQILPYFEQEALYNTQPNSLLPLTTPVSPFLCAMRSRPGYYTGGSSGSVVGFITTQEPEPGVYIPGVLFTINPGSSYTYNNLSTNIGYFVQINHGSASIAYWWQGNPVFTTTSSSTTVGFGSPGAYIVITALSGSTGSDYDLSGPATDFGINPYITESSKSKDTLGMHAHRMKE